jgi:hypothetical protein
LIMLALSHLAVFGVMSFGCSGSVGSLCRSGKRTFRCQLSIDLLPKNWTTSNMTLLPN